MTPCTVRDALTLEALCNAGSVRHAARDLGITETAIYNRLRRLERSRNTVLYTRRRGIGGVPAKAAFDLLLELTPLLPCDEDDE